MALAVNLLFLWIFGNTIEDAMGPAPFAAGKTTLSGWVMVTWRPATSSDSGPVMVIMVIPAIFLVRFATCVT